VTALGIGRRVRAAAGGPAGALFVCAVWALAIVASYYVHPTTLVHRCALFCHLAALIVGFGAVLLVDWCGLLYLARRRTTEDVVRVACAAHPLVWIGLAGLVASGVALEPNLAATATRVKLALVLVIGWNGLLAGKVSERLGRLPLVARPARGVLAAGCAVAIVSQLGWWGSTLIGFITATH
jgi:hypothetical protein